MRQRTIFYKTTNTFCFFSFSFPGFISHPPFLQAAIPIQDTFSDNIVMLEFRVKTILQWNPVNAVTNGPKKFDVFNGVAVLPGQGQIS